MKRMKLFSLVIAVLMIAVIAEARDVRGKQNFTDEVNIDNGGKFKLQGTEVTSSATELNLMDGVTATTDEINAAADKSSVQTTASLTNGASLTISASTPKVVVTGIGGADDTTNTVTIATPYPVGVTATIIIDSASTNLIQIADSTTVMALGANWVGDNTDTLTIYFASTNEAVEVSASNN